MREIMALLSTTDTNYVVDTFRKCTYSYKYISLHVIAKAFYKEREKNITNSVIYPSTILLLLGRATGIFLYLSHLKKVSLLSKSILQTRKKTGSTGFNI